MSILRNEYDQNMSNISNSEYERSPNRQSHIATMSGESAQSVHVPTVSGSVHNGSITKDATNLKVSLSSMAASAGAQSGSTPSNQVVAATEPELMGTAFASLTLNEFEIENCLKPSNYENGLGEDTMIDTLLFSNQHNINIPILQSKGQQELELNLPLFQEMTYFDGITHSKQIEQSTSYLPCRCTIAKIEVDPCDGSKILEDKRISPRTASDNSAVLPLFITKICSLCGFGFEYQEREFQERRRCSVES